MVTEIRRCINCGEEKKASKFTKFTTICNDCGKGKKPKKTKSKKEYSRNYSLVTKYGINEDIYNEMFTRQGGKCAICERHQADIGKLLFIDHNHTTGKVRELLCANCNSAIGLFYEDLKYLQNAIFYLTKHK